MIYAPILITTLHRYECLKKCVESLQENSWADQTELFISVDYPPSEKYMDGYKKIKHYLKQEIIGFKSVTVFFQEKNLGASKNATWLREMVCSKYDRYIFLEDDNELAPGFIEYCDKGLELFEKDETVLAINATDYVWCGNNYTPPVRQVKNNENNVEKRQLVFHATANWNYKKEKVMEFCSVIEKQNGLCKIKDLLKLYKKSSCFFYQFLAMVSLQNEKLPWYKGSLRPIDFMMDIYMILFDKYVVCPIEPLQRDLGVDGNGVNYQNAFENAASLRNRPLRKEKGFEFCIDNPIKESDYEIKLHDKNMRLSYLSKTKILLKYAYKVIKKRKKLN